MTSVMVRVSSTARIKRKELTTSIMEDGERAYEMAMGSATTTTRTSMLVTGRQASATARENFSPEKAINIRGNGRTI